MSSPKPWPRCHDNENDAMLIKLGKLGIDVFASVIRAGTSILPPASRLAAHRRVLDKLDIEMTLDIGGGKVLRLCVPDEGSISRNQRILTKEPMTIEWLDSMGPGDVLWDVGANIGSYSLYAAKRRAVVAVAFEPMAESYIALTRNVILNGLEDLVLPCAIALSATPGPGFLTLTSTLSGASGHLFTVANSHGEGISRQPVIGTDASTLVSALCLPQPTHLKIDVDGLELHILKGSAGILNHPDLRSILIEVNQDGDAIINTLTRAGFVETGAERDNRIFRRPDDHLDA